VIFAQHFAHNLGAFAGGPVEVQPHLMQAEQNPPVDGLQAIAAIGQSSSYDHAHGVIQIRAFHLIFDIDRDEVFTVAGREKRPAARPILVGQKELLKGLRNEMQVTGKTTAYCAFVR
jgi:hypothetical protein